MVALISCSQESNSLISKTWHNTTARYNAYFLAKERLKLVEAKIWEAQADDYNRLLNIFPIVDTNFSKTLKADLDYMFERASIPPTKHKNSKWVDDSYIIIGKVKLYENRLDSASFAFKYVNSKSKDDQTRYSALTWLIRTYILNGEMKFASDVHTYLLSQKMVPKVRREFLLTSAYYYRTIEDQDKSLSQLKKAIPLVRDSDYRSRLHYIVGQLHQKKNQPDSAYYHYSMVLKKNPPYDLSFFAKLNMSQVSNPTEEQEIKKIRKYFSKMLVDLKNEEFRDRIYYDMAQFELKQGNRDSSISLLKTSLKVDGGVTPHMKAYAYLSLGKIHYNHPTMEKLKKYTLAKLYYDSTVVEMDTLFENHDFIVERKQTLADFVTQIETIQKEDSLQRLAKMDKTELSAFLDDYKIKEEERLKEEAKAQLAREEALKKKQKNQQSVNTGFYDPNAQTNTNFVFYKPVELANSLAKFKEKWGDRKLEDNWRRSEKDLVIMDENLPIETDTLVDSLATANADSLLAQKKLEIENISVDKEALYNDIPRSDTALAKSDEKLKKAFYLLGKIYDQKLEEPENAIITFQELQSRYPNHDQVEEVYYFLYLLCDKTKTCNSDEYKTILLTKYPNSIYAHAILNPNYILETKIADKKVHQLYESAYNTYNQSRYLAAHNQVNSIITTYPHNDIMDKLVFLRILTYAKTDKIALYKSSLEQFIAEDHKKSKIVPYAKELLEEINKKGPAALVPADSNFTKHADTTHYFIAVFNKEAVSYQKNLDIFYEFHNTYYKDSSYATRWVDFDSLNYLIVVKNFNKTAHGKKYIEKLIHWNKFSGHYKDIDYSYSIIDEKNYATLLARREIDVYTRFYKKHYK